MYGVIDIGSNTIRLVIYKIKDNTIVPIINKKNVVGLAGYINKKKCMKKSGMLKAVETLNEFREIIHHMDEMEVFPFATASLRNIENSQDALEYIKENTCFDIRVFSGDEEAVFDYYGAIQSTEMNSGLLIDIGGGSTELVAYKDKEVIATQSLPIGSFNMYTKYVKNILPTAKEIANIQKEVNVYLEEMKWPQGEMNFASICGVGGSARAAQKLLLEMKKIKDVKSEYSCSKLTEIVSLVESNDRLLLGGILKSSPDRIHTLLPGVTILEAIADYYNSTSIITSRYGVREGYLYHLLKSRGELNAN